MKINHELWMREALKEARNAFNNNESVAYLKIDNEEQIAVYTNLAERVSEIELVKSDSPKEEEEEEKLIENKTKMNIEDLKGVDKKILAAAKVKVAEERALKQQGLACSTV